MTTPHGKRVEAAFHLTPEQRNQHPDGPEAAPLAHTVCESNPLGIGFTEEWYLKARESKALPAPRIDSPENPVTTLGKTYLPQGFGIITKAWRQRLELAGTYDEEWREKRWPYLPEDFDVAYWNGAHPDMQVPYLNGNETIELTNLMLPDAFPSTHDVQGNSVVSFSLPGQGPYLLVQYETGEKMPVDLHIDTLLVDTETAGLSLVYRALLPGEPEIRGVEIHMRAGAVEFNDSEGT